MALVVAAPDGALQHEIEEFGLALWERIQHALPGPLRQRYWQERLLDRAMRDEDFRVNVLRLVDVLPALHTSAQVTEHAQEYLLAPGDALPGLVRAPLRLASNRALRGLAANTIRSQVRRLGERFIVGATPYEALPALRRLHDRGIGFTVDLLGEATLSLEEARQYQERYLELIDVLAEEAASWPRRAAVDEDARGAAPRVNVSVKVSALDPALDPLDPAGGVERLRDRLLPLFLHAKDRFAFIHLDMEQWSIHEITMGAFEAVLDHPDLRSWPHAGIVVQAYLRSAEEDVDRLAELARRRGAPVTVRLVKGAYWDYEQIRARQFGYPCPVFSHKADTDANYEALTVRLLDNAEWLYPAFASHNVRSVSHAIVQARRRGIAKNGYEIQMLYGMAEPERAALRSLDERIRIYAPVGELIPGMAYLVRRLLENTSNQGFLRQAHREKVSMSELLQPPRPSDGDNGSPAARSSASPERRADIEFENCPFTDFTDPYTRGQFLKAVKMQGENLPVRVPVVVDGEVRSEGDAFERPCPSDPARKVADVVRATVDDADRAVAAALEAFPTWRDRPLEDRARLLEALADRLQADRAELAALMAYEVGKPLEDADADVAEAVDFCRYYAREAEIELAPKSLGTVPGERNLWLYEGRGPTAVIAPWNFPLAILCGMSTAALVAGNPILMKPAEQSSAVGYALFRRMREAGFPAGVVHFLPGIGEEVGKRLVEHPQVAGIAFTGSKEVGLSIIEAAGRTHPDQRLVKRVVCEMGGKNAIVVDDDADLDEAVQGVVKSAFGYAGQKCSACSRALAVGAAFEPFVARLVEATRSLITAPAHDPSCQLPPVVDREAYGRLMDIVENPPADVEVLYRGEVVAGGWYVPPLIVRVQNPDHPLMQTELFGPILAVAQVGCFDEALEWALHSPYALTGSVYSRNPRHLDRAAREFRAGNLYLNRGSTGARVHRQPFGGAGLSGGGTKAGGPGYLLHFADPRVITENTVRHGFAPELTL